MYVLVIICKYKSSKKKYLLYYNKWCKIMLLIYFLKFVNVMYICIYMKNIVLNINLKSNFIVFVYYKYLF